jgi:hypothetical protein
MSAKIKLFSWGIFTAIMLGAIPSSYAFELECGTYEFVGRYDSNQNLFWLSEGTEAEMSLRLRGRKLLTGFLPNNSLNYRIKAELAKKVGNSGGPAKLIDVIDVAHSPKQMIPFKRLGAQGCAVQNKAAPAKTASNVGKH